MVTAFDAAVERCRGAASSQVSWEVGREGRGGRRAGEGEGGERRAGEGEGEGGGEMYISSRFY